MGGRIQFAPTIIRDSKPFFHRKYKINPVGEKTRSITSLQSIKETLSEQETQHDETGEKPTDYG